jgi:hypothetical protein
MRPLLLLCFGVLLPAAPAAGQGSRPLGRWDREVKAELRKAGKALEQQGYRLRGEPMLGTLNQGEVDSLWTGLRDGVAYALVGVCDSACTNLDLRLFDDASHELAAALEPGPPVLRVTPTQRTKYRLRVIMAACNHSPCRYSVGIFER